MTIYVRTVINIGSYRAYRKANTVRRLSQLQKHPSPQSCQASLSFFACSRLPARSGPCRSTSVMSDPMIENECGVELSALASASAHLTALLKSQGMREQHIQEMCNSVWTVVQQQYSVSGRCGDQQQYTVSHEYTQQVCVVDAAKFDGLQVEMKAHMDFATKEIASSLFEHALCEARLLGFAQKKLIAVTQTTTCPLSTLHPSLIPHAPS